MSPLVLVLAAAGVQASSGMAALALALARRPRAGTLLAAIGAILGGALGFAGAAAALGSGFTGELAAAWHVPGGAFVVGLDPLSACFLLPLHALGAICALYGRSYLGPRVGPAGGLNLLLVAMTLVLVARQAVLFLFAWEAMTLLSFLLVTTDHEDPDVRRAGWAYLISSHVAMSALIALFVSAGAGLGGAGLMVLALIGFGTKAGMIGLHVWLPEAHAAAPSHVSALMSGVLTKMGVYGLLRAVLLLAPGAWIGPALMLLGGVGALIGVALALYQRDLKRALAYSTIENLGVILLALGLGLWARARGDAALAAIAFAGGLLHVWNHSAMKGLMFLAAGNVVHGAGGRDLERLGGLLRRMPWTGRAMILGAVAIAALPPLNGFVGEWLIFRALAEVGIHGAAAAALLAMAGAALLALVGGLAALCFVRLTGIALLGEPRGEAAARAHDPGAGLLGPVLTLAGLCLVGALAAPALVGALAPVLAQLGAASAPAPLAVPIVITNAALLAAAALLLLLLQRRARSVERPATWDCGYAAPTARMQYTGRSFAELLLSRALPRWLRPRLRVRPPEGPFPAAASFSSTTGDPLTRGVYEPLLGRLADRFARLRFLQQGNVHIYVLYIVAAAIVALAWVGVRDGWAR